MFLETFSSFCFFQQPFQKVLQKHKKEMDILVKKHEKVGARVSVGAGGRGGEGRGGG